MLSLSSAAANEYYLTLARQDYYQGGFEPRGHYAGQGAAVLGLRGEVKAEVMRALMEGYDPTGKPLVQNAGKLTRQQATDCCFSCPKSVSTLWSQADLPTRRAIEAANDTAVRAACGYLEAAAGWTRRGRGGATCEAAKLVFALFEHGSSRLGDPNLHVHAILFNLGVRADNSTGSIESKQVYVHKLAAGSVFRAELAVQLEQRLGLTITRKGPFFEIAGVPEDLCRAFSQRRTQIEEEIARRGITTAAGAAAVALATRTAKKALTRDTLRQQWRAVGEGFGFGAAQVAQLLGMPPRHKADITPLLRAGVAHLMQGESHFTERALLRFVAEAAPGTGLGAADLIGGMKRFLAQEPSLVAIAPDSYTTRDMLAVEQTMLSSAQRLHESKRHQVGQGTVIKAAQKAEKAASAKQKKSVKLSTEQQAALEYVTTQPGSLKIVSGMAGTGKTFFLAAAKGAWETAGYEVIGASLAGKAARGLQEGAGIESATLSRLLMDLDQSVLGTVGHHLWQLSRAARGKKTWGPPTKMSLDAKTVLVVDEAALVGSVMMNALIAAVEKAGAKLVLVGDARQLQSIESGGSFLALQERFGATELTAIQRQREPWARQAVKDFAHGRTAEALAAYAERGLLTVTRTRHEAMEKLLTDWAKVGIDRPEDAVIFTGLRAERAVMNRWAQQERKKAGKLGFNAVTIEGDKFHEGDRVAFIQNSKKLGVENGTLGTIDDVSLLGGRVRVRLDSGTCVSFSLSQYRALTLAYVTTTFKGQGQTVETAFVLAGGPTQTREQSYVQMSRAKGATHLYWDNAEPGPLLEPLVQAMQTSRQKELASVVQARNAASVPRATATVKTVVRPTPMPTPTPVVRSESPSLLTTLTTSLASISPQPETGPQLETPQTQTPQRSSHPKIAPRLRP